MTVAGTVSASIRRDTFAWTVSASFWQAELKKAREAGNEKQSHVWSPSFGRGCWRLQVDLMGEDEFSGLYLSPADAPILPVTVSFRFEFTTGAVPTRKIRGPLGGEPYRFDAGTLWGYSKAIAWKEIDALESTNGIVITVTITRKAPTTTPRIPLSLFNSPYYGDVAFHLATANAWIFGLKPVLAERSAHLHSLLSSDFAEGTSSSLLDPEASFDPPADLRTGDLDEFVGFSTPEDPSEVSDAEETPVKASRAAPSDTTHDSSATVNSEAQHSTAADKTPSRPATPLPPATQKRYHRIEVHDCSYWTFFSYLYWIYYDEVCFAPSRATVFSDPREEQEFQDCSDIRTFPKIGKKHNTPPCDPHAMYRLADRHLHENLRNLARNSIVASLTPETATYEAFSALSRGYQDVRLAIVQYIVKNIDAVRNSSGWTRMLELLDEGRLSGGAGVLDKILEGVAAAARAKDPQ